MAPEIPINKYNYWTVKVYKPTTDDGLSCFLLRLAQNTLIKFFLRGLQAIFELIMTNMVRKPSQPVRIWEKLPPDANF